MNLALLSDELTGGVNRTDPASPKGYAGTRRSREMPKIGNTEVAQDVLEAAHKVRSYLGTIRRREGLHNMALTIEAGGRMEIGRQAKIGEELEPEKRPDEGLILLEREAAGREDAVGKAAEKLEAAKEKLRALKANATDRAKKKANEAVEKAGADLNEAKAARDQAAQAVEEYKAGEGS